MEKKSCESKKNLSGIVTICAQCKKIRDKAGQWHLQEEYSMDHSKIDFSHGYCPECAEQVMAEVKAFKVDFN